MIRLGAILILLTAAATAAQTVSVSPDDRFITQQLLYSDDFKDLSNWTAELEKGGTVAANDGAMEIDVPAGCSVWFKPKLSGSLMIQYDATVIKAGGSNDRVSDLNCFWMARDARSPDDLFATKRTGKFSDYDQLLCYYVGQGGNTNTTTRFRRYIGKQDNRPLLPENDLSDPSDLLKPNQSQRIRLLACGKTIEYWRDAKKLFELDDSDPYTSGWFAIRTTKNHMKVTALRIWRMADH